MAAKWGRAALPPLLPFNLEPDAHFGRALQRAQQPLPYEDLPVSDLDLKYVADAYAAPRPSLASMDNELWALYVSSRGAGRG